MFGFQTEVQRQCYLKNKLSKFNQYFLGAVIARRRYQSHTTMIPVLEFFFNKVAGMKACNFIKKRLQHRSPVTEPPSEFSL